ncbi:MAG: lipopolysaccharide biosynthesis protein, partial [Bacteroidales bacterium]|nr:lipopolysaccharide biosynthesis protein [Bacteroidales bacterium]
LEQVKNKVIKGVFWSSVERFSAQGVQFILGIILARLLSPSDYGLLGMIVIFIAISQAFVLSGLGAALIQKIDRDEKDFSTTFYYNLIVSIFFYAILFFSAPYIANFYNEPLLVNITRAIGLSIIIEAFGEVQRTQFIIKVDFKNQTKASVLSIVISGLLGIFLAYNGFGAWALVVQSLTRSFINVCALWYISKWLPKEKFYYNRFKKLFSFSSKLLIAGLIHTFTGNFYQLFIGKAFSSNILGLYSRANSFALFPSQNLEAIISRVTFPILCELQNDRVRLMEMFQKIIKSTALLILPLMTILVVLSKPLILTLLTEKWKDSIELLQIVSVGLMFLPINSINVQIFGVTGRTDWVLKTDLVKQILLLGFLLGTFPFGVKAIVFGQSAAYILTYFVNLIIIQRVVDYKAMNQIAIILPIFLFSFTLGGAVYLTGTFFSTQPLKLILGGSVGALLWFITIWIFNAAKFRTSLKELF